MRARCISENSTGSKARPGDTVWRRQAGSNVVSAALELCPVLHCFYVFEPFDRVTQLCEHKVDVNLPNQPIEEAPVRCFPGASVSLDLGHFELHVVAFALQCSNARLVRPHSGGKVQAGVGLKGHVSSSRTGLAIDPPE